MGTKFNINFSNGKLLWVFSKPVSFHFSTKTALVAAIISARWMGEFKVFLRTKVFYFSQHCHVISCQIFFFLLTQVINLPVVIFFFSLTPYICRRYCFWKLQMLKGLWRKVFVFTGQGRIERPAQYSKGLRAAAGSPCLSTRLLLPNTPATCGGMLLLHQQSSGILFYSHHLFCELVLCTACTRTLLHAGLLPSSGAFLFRLSL